MRNEWKKFVCVLLIAVLTVSGCGSRKTPVPPETTEETVGVTGETSGAAEETAGAEEESVGVGDSADMTNDADAENDAEAGEDVTSSYVVTLYPTIQSDVPDPDVIRVGETYYMVSTTMNLCPGVPIMKSTDLVHWQIVNYVYETLEDDDITNLEHGADMYSRGSWAASLKYDEDTSLYYVGFMSNNHGFYVYTTADIENGSWTKYHTTRWFHDPALFLEDGRLYVITASGGSCRIQELALNPDGGIDIVGEEKILFTSGDWGLWEGAHVYHVNDAYYVFVIASPTDRWIRTQLCYRTDDLWQGKWEEKTIYQGGIGNSQAGLAQGGIVDTVQGDWYAFAFQDRGGIGRCPSIVAVRWEDGWPMMGVYDAEGRFVTRDYMIRMVINLPESGQENWFVDSDEFDYREGEKLKLVWQWNHNPRNDFWSVTEAPGYLRLTTDAVVNNICYAHNSLTQRTVGPKFESEIKISTDHMKAGDYAGLCAMADQYAMVGVLCDEDGKRHIYQANGLFRESFDTPNEVVETPLAEGQEVYLKIAYTFKSGSSDNALFYYSLDGVNWNAIGERFPLGFSTATTFMGTRTWLFHYATETAGGYVDIDYYRVR